MQQNRRADISNIWKQT